MKNYIPILIAVVVTMILFSLKILFNYSLLSESILALTALIVLWYTLETYEIRKATQETIFKTQRPAVSYQLFVHENNPFDTRFRLTNNSDYPVAVRVKCSFSIENDPIEDIWPSYDGIEYWNLQYRQTKEGHFNLLSLYGKKLFNKDEATNLFQISKKKLNRKIISKIKKQIIAKLEEIPVTAKEPKLLLHLEVFSENDKGMYIYYPKVKFVHDLNRDAWIPFITSKMPYWELTAKPDWLNQ